MNKNNLTHTSISLNLTFECQHFSLINELCFYEIKPKNDNFLVFERRYIGICQESSWSNFVNNPNSAYLSEVVRLNKTDEHFSLIQNTHLQEVIEDQGDLSIYSAFFKSLKDYDFAQTIEDLVSHKAQIVYTPRLSNKIQSIYRLDQKLIYTPSFLNLSDDILECIFTNIVEKTLFFNKLISLQKSEHLFTDDSFFDFISEHVKEGTAKDCILHNHAVTLNSHTPIKDDWSNYGSKKHIGPTLQIKDSAIYQNSFELTQEIMQNFFTSNSSHITNFIILNMSGVLDIIGISTDKYNDAYFSTLNLLEEKTTILSLLDKKMLHDKLFIDMQTTTQPMKKNKI